MKQIFSKFFLVALLGVLGVSSALAAVVSVPCDTVYLASDVTYFGTVKYNSTTDNIYEWKSGDSVKITICPTETGKYVLTFLSCTDNDGSTLKFSINNGASVLAGSPVGIPNNESWTTYTNSHKVCFGDLTQGENYTITIVGTNTGGKAVCNIKKLVFAKVMPVSIPGNVNVANDIILKGCSIKVVEDHIGNWRNNEAVSFVIKPTESGHYVLDFKSCNKNNGNGKLTFSLNNGASVLEGSPTTITKTTDWISYTNSHKVFFSNLKANEEYVVTITGTSTADVGNIKDLVFSKIAPIAIPGRVNLKDSVMFLGTNIKYEVENDNIGNWETKEALFFTIRPKQTGHYVLTFNSSLDSDKSNANGILNISISNGSSVLEGSPTTITKTSGWTSYTNSHKVLFSNLTADEEYTIKIIGTTTFNRVGNIKNLVFKDTTIYEIGYNGNGGSGTMPSQLWKEGSVLNPNQFTAPAGKVFVGWNTKADGSGTAYAEGASFEVIPGSTPSLTTLYAQWGNICTITYDPNGGTGTMSNQVINIAEDTLRTNTFSAPAALGEGYTFAGWNTQADGLGTSYNRFKITIYTPESLTLYAQWVNKAQVQSLLKLVPIDMTSLNGNCIIGANETPKGIKSGDYYFDKTGAYFSKESNFSSWIGQGCTELDTCYQAKYGLPTKDTINDGLGIMVPFEYHWSGTTGAFDGNDAIHLTSPNQEHTLKLNNATELEKLYFCGVAGGVSNESSTIIVTVTYTDNTTSSGTFKVKDWFQSDKDITNSKLKYARFATGGLKISGQYEKGKYIYGAYMYCFSMNTALNTKKVVKSITFKHGSKTNTMVTAIFAVTGQQCASAPKEPENRVCHMTKETTVISFDEVTKNKVDQTITGVTYEYLISSKPDFSDTLVLKDLNFVKEGKRIIGTINQNYSGRYIRVRAENNAGYSDFVDVTYKHKVTILPYTHGQVTGISADSTYAAGAKVSLTATPATNYAFKGWVVEEDTLTTNPFTIDSITYDWTVQPSFSINNVTVTFKENGGVLAGEKTKLVTIGQPYGDLPTPTFGKYNFKGWFTDSIGGDTVKSTTIVTLTTDHNLWAHWVPQEVGDGSNDSIVTEAQKKVNDKLKTWVEECDGTNAINLTINRKIYKDTYYNTLCLPFNLTNEQIVETFGTYKELKQFVSATVTGDETNRTITIELKDTSAIACGKAYLISFEDGETLTELVFNNVIVRDSTVAEAVKSGNMAYQGIFAPFHLTDNDKDLLFLGDNNKLYWPNADGTFMKGFRAYFKVTTQQQSPSSPYKRGMKAMFGDKKTPTGIVNEYENENENEIRKLIEQGRVVIITNGKKYDLQGNPL